MWKMTLAYDGTDFQGWQVQPGKPTIQGTLADVLKEITGEMVLPQGSGRTDAGVHAEGQVVSVELAAPIPPDRFLRAINRRLPASIRLLAAEHADTGFHARSEILSKTYEYRIFERRGGTAELGSTAERRSGIADRRGIVDRRGGQASDEAVCLPWQARYVWDCRWPLRLDRMQEAAKQVIGRHDFTSFAAHDPDRSQRILASAGVDGAPSNVREIFSSSWQIRNGIFCYRVSGTGFLHHMVRNLVGTFVEIGAERRQVDSIVDLLKAKDRRLAGATAPPQGLFLLHVDYKPAQITRPAPAARRAQAAAEAPAAAQAQQARALARVGA